MKDLIRKILRETLIVTSDTPDWVEKFHDLSKEERIQFIKDYKVRIERLIPAITDYFESKFGDLLVAIDVDEVGTHYGNENFSTRKPNLKFYFRPRGMEKIDGRELKREIYKDLKSFFNIDVAYYGTPLEFTVYQMTWEKV